MPGSPRGLWGADSGKALATLVGATFVGALVVAGTIPCDASETWFWVTIGAPGGLLAFGLLASYARRELRDGDVRLVPLVLGALWRLAAGAGLSVITVLAMMPIALSHCPIL